MSKDKLGRYDEFYERLRTRVGKKSVYKVVKGREKQLGILKVYDVPTRTKHRDIVYNAIYNLEMAYGKQARIQNYCFVGPINITPNINTDNTVKFNLI